MPSFEFNFIWVGNNLMPEAQINNIANMSIVHPNAKINLWVMPEIVNKQIKQFVASKANVLLRDIANLIDKCTSPTTYEIVELLKKSILWSCLGDILKLLILTRELETGASLKRFYMEGDNQYPVDLDKIINGRGFVLHVVEIARIKYLRCDSFFIDLSHLNGMWFKQGLRTHLERILSDEVINFGLKKIIDNNCNNEADIINSFGALPGALVKIVMCRVPNFIKDHMHTEFALAGIYARRSWQDPNATRLENGMIAMLVDLRLRELVQDTILEDYPPQPKIAINDYAIAKWQRQGLRFDLWVKSGNVAYSSANLYFFYQKNYVKRWDLAYLPDTSAKDEFKLKKSWLPT